MEVKQEIADDPFHLAELEGQVEELVRDPQDALDLQLQGLEPLQGVGLQIVDIGEE